MNQYIAKRYQIMKHIGHGGMADVYLAWDRVLNRQVAIKMIRQDKSLDPMSLIRFKQEAIAASKLIHPNIIEIYDVVDYQNRSFIVMEYVKGQTLKNIIKSRGAVIESEAILIMKQLTSAIISAHYNGVIHRDIKSQNVIVKADGTTKILDFGISILTDSIDNSPNDAIMGSIHYLAPEVVQGSLASIQSDIYALGIVFFEILVGDVPFKDTKIVNIALKHINQQMPDIRLYNNTISDNVARIIQKATHKTLAYRYKNANELLYDLNTYTQLQAQHLTNNTINPNIIYNPNFNQTYNLPNNIPDKPMTNTNNQVLKNYNYNSQTNSLDTITNTITNDNIKKISNKDKFKDRFDDSMYEDKYNSKNKKKSNNKIVIIVSIIICLIFSLFILYISGVINLPFGGVTMPNIINKDIEQATKELEELGIEINFNTIKRELTENITKGNIISSNYQQGDKVSKGTKIDIVVSDGLFAYMNDFIGWDILLAKNSILDTFPNVKVIEVPTRSIDNSLAGTIIEQNLIKANDKFDPSKPSEIELVYVEYKSLILAHDLLNTPIDNAKLTLEQQGFKVIVSLLEYSDLTIEERKIASPNTVIRSDPPLGTSYTQTANNNITLYFVTELE